MKSSLIFTLVVVLLLTSCQTGRQSEKRVTLIDSALSNSLHTRLLPIDTSDSFKQLLNIGDELFCYIDYCSLYPSWLSYEQVSIKLYHPEDDQIEEFIFHQQQIFDQCPHFQNERYSLDQNPFPLGLIENAKLMEELGLNQKYFFLYGINTMESKVELWLSSVNYQYHIFIDTMPEYEFYTTLMAYDGRPFDYSKGMLSYIQHDNIKTINLHNLGTQVYPWDDHSSKVFSLQKNIYTEQYFLSGRAAKIVPKENPLDRKLLLQQFHLSEHLVIVHPLENNKKGMLFIRRHSLEPARYFETEHQHFKFFSHAFGSENDDQSKLSDYVLFFSNPADTLEIMDISTFSTITVDLASLGYPRMESVLSHIFVPNDSPTLKLLIIPYNFTDGSSDTFFELVFNPSMEAKSLSPIILTQNKKHQHLAFHFLEESNKLISVAKNRESREYEVLSFCSNNDQDMFKLSFSVLELPSDPIDSVKIYSKESIAPYIKGHAILQLTLGELSQRHTQFYNLIISDLPSDNI